MVKDVGGNGEQDSSHSQTINDINTLLLEITNYSSTDSDSEEDDSKRTDNVFQDKIGLVLKYLEILVLDTTQALFVYITLIRLNQHSLSYANALKYQNIYNKQNEVFCNLPIN